MAKPNNRVVIVVHGFASHRIVMRPLCTYLARRHVVLNWGYPSLFPSVRVHAENLIDKISAELSPETLIDFVAHSMGAVIIRQMLSQHPLPNLGRLLFITPPNLGSPAARWATPLIGWLCRCLPDISTNEQSLVNQLPREAPGETAVIAARYDWLAPVWRTHLIGLSDHQTLHATHNSVLFSRKAAAMADHFLRCGNLESNTSS